MSLSVLFSIHRDIVMVSTFSFCITLCCTCMLYYNIIQVMGLVLYGIVAVLHKNRLRPDEESFDQQLLLGGHLN